MKIEFTNDEMAVLTAIILAMSEDVEKGMFDQEDVKWLKGLKNHSQAYQIKS